MIYGIEVYSNTSKKALDKLCKLNNKILRILLSKKLRTPVPELYSSMHTFPIPFLHEINILKFIHKCLYNKHLVPEIFHEYYTESCTLHSHFTRRRNDLFLSSINSTFGFRNSMFHGSSLWNKLPNNLKNITSIPLFNKELKQIYRSL